MPLTAATVAFDFVSPDNPSRSHSRRSGPTRQDITESVLRRRQRAMRGRLRSLGGRTRGLRSRQPVVPSRDLRLSPVRTSICIEAAAHSRGDHDGCDHTGRLDLLQQRPRLSGARSDYICRTVRIVAPIDGVMTIEALSVANGTHPSLAVETVYPATYLWRFENPTSITVAAGTEVMANIEMPASSSTRESVMLTTAMALR